MFLHVEFKNNNFTLTGERYFVDKYFQRIHTIGIAQTVADDYIAIKIGMVSGGTIYMLLPEFSDPIEIIPILSNILKRHFVNVIEDIRESDIEVTIDPNEISASRLLII